MNTVKYLGFAGLAAASLFAAQAFATICPVNGQGQQTEGSPVCIAPYGSDGPGTGLVDKLGPGSDPNSIFTSGSPGIDPYTQQVQKPYWSVLSSSGSVSTILLQIAGYSGRGTFGIFDPNDHNNKLPLLTNGSNGTQALLSVYVNGGYALNLGPKTYFSTTNYFGYYLTTGGGQTFYSQPLLNEAGGAVYPHGMPHMVAYAGDNSVNNTIQPLYGLAGGPFGTNEYILAWEDLPWGTSDLDYNDFVVLVESVRPVPEPAALGMFGLGVLLIGGFVTLRRRSLKA